MKAGAILSEALRNIVTGASRSALLVSLFVVLCGSMCATEAAAIGNILREAEDFQSAGATTFVLSAEGGVSGSQCESLGRGPNVIAAGAVRVAQGASVTALPVSGVALREVTPGFLRAIAPATGWHSPPQQGAVVPASIADTLGIKQGEFLETSNGRLLIGSVIDYPDDGRDPTLANSVLGVVSDDGVFDECWTSLSSYDPTALHLLQTAVSPSFPAEDDVSVRQLNSRLGQQFDGAARYAGRPTRYAPYLALGAAAMLAFAGVWTRRLSLASDRHAGVRRSDQLAQLTAEAVLWGWSALIVMLAVARAWLEFGTYSAVREKRLFTYFKHR